MQCTFCIAQILWKNTSTFLFDSQKLYDALNRDLLYKHLHVCVLAVFIGSDKVRKPNLSFGGMRTEILSSYLKALESRDTMSQ